MSDKHQPQMCRSAKAIARPQLLHLNPICTLISPTAILRMWESCWMVAAARDSTAARLLRRSPKITPSVLSHSNCRSRNRACQVVIFREESLLSFTLIILVSYPTSNPLRYQLMLSMFIPTDRRSKTIPAEFFEWGSLVTRHDARAAGGGCSRTLTAILKDVYL